AEALVDVALALEKQEDIRVQELLGEVREVAQTVERSDTRAAIFHQLVRALVGMGDLAEAERTAETISLYEFRADAFREIADAVREANPCRANEMLRRALGEARAIPDEQRRQRLITRLLDSVVRTEGIQRGIEALEGDSFNDFIGALVRWAPWLEKLNPAF